MAKKKPSQPEALVTYTARAKDLRILGRVEAAREAGEQERGDGEGEGVEAEHEL